MEGVGRVSNETPLAAVTLEQVQEAMQEDKFMKMLVKAVQTGQGRTEMRKSAYGQVMTELSYVHSVLLQADRMVFRSTHQLL